MIEPRRSSRPRLLAPVALALLMVALAGCSISGGTLGGREKCWPAEPPRAASIWRGVLAIDENGGQLWTPEGEVIVLWPGALSTRIGADGTGELVSGNDVVARAGQDLTLFGGMGADGALVVCGIEEIHSS
jgi:hypothetical protein